MSPEIRGWRRKNGFFEERPEQTNVDGLSPLIAACQQGRSDVVEYLLGQGADLEALDRYGNNALWAACYSEDSRCVALLIEAGIDLNYPNQASGATALVYAASSGRERVVKQLLEAGADASIATQDDFTALELASTRNILTLLKQNTKRI